MLQFSSYLPPPTMSADSVSALDPEKGFRFSNGMTNASDLTLTFNIKSASTTSRGEHKQILSNISGFVRAGEVSLCLSLEWS